MASTDPTVENLFTVCGQASIALAAGDWLTARTAACQMQAMMVYLGSSVSASGTNFQLAVEAATSLIANIERLQIYHAQKTTRGRLIKTSLRNEGRGHRNGQGNGISHD